MRIDLYLKTSKLIKRRTVANLALTKELVLVNGKIVKPSYNVKLDDTIKMNLGNKEITVKVISTNKLDSNLMYELINESYK